MLRTLILHQRNYVRAICSLRRPLRPMYTASSLFFKALKDAGVTHAFVNWGSDHPALLEDLERQRQDGGEGKQSIEIVTCPNEMVALSAAQGYAQTTGGKPAAVIVHVDVGTQALAGAVHNVDRCKTPVLIYAGASPFSLQGESKGTRNEWIMWLQDIPDQSAIVRQYMRFTSQINSGKTVPQVVNRSLQIATSEPKGPVYLWARREVMEEEVEPTLMQAPSNFSKWPSLEPCGLAPSAASRLGSALLQANSPLIITSHIGRNPHALTPLLTLSTLLSIPIFSTCPSTVNVPFSHPFAAGVTFLAPGTHTPHLRDADVILVIDSDVPWIMAHGPASSPHPSAKVFVIDSSDPLNSSMNVWHVDAEMVCKADASHALAQIIEAVKRLDKEGCVGVSEYVLGSKSIRDRGRRLEAAHKERVRALDEAENVFLTPSPPSPMPSPPVVGTTTVPSPLTVSLPPAPKASHYTVPNILGVLRKSIKTQTPSQGFETLLLNEAISNYALVHMHMRPEIAGSLLTSGGSSLGWALGAAVGASIGGDVASGGKRLGYELIVVVVGDGSFMFGVPSTVYWMARKYDTPFLTIILNNGGWKSPKLSMLGVHPTGLGSQQTGERLTVGFGPHAPDYSQIAVAASAGWAWGRKVSASTNSLASKNLLEETINEAVKVVLQERRCAVVDCVIESI